MKSIAMSHRRHLRPTLRHLPPALFALLLAATLPAAAKELARASSPDWLMAAMARSSPAACSPKAAP